MAASITQSYAIQDFMAQYLISTTTADKFRRVIFFVYAISFILYTLFSFGGFVILNRQSSVDEPDTIEQFFPSDGWQVQIIYWIYTVHMITVCP